MILAPSAAQIRCSYFADGGTMSKKCQFPPQTGCVPGCSDNGGNPNWCRDVRPQSEAVYQCAFKASDLGAMLVHHEQRPFAYNEVVVDPTSWTAANIRHYIEAFYFLKPPPPTKGKVVQSDEVPARDLHRRFHERYGADVTVPLVRLELHPPPGRAPFVRIA